MHNSFKTLLPICCYDLSCGIEGVSSRFRGVWSAVCGRIPTLSCSLLLLSSKACIHSPFVCSVIEYGWNPCDVITTFAWGARDETFFFQFLWTMLLHYTAQLHIFKFALNIVICSSSETQSEQRYGLRSPVLGINSTGSHAELDFLKWPAFKHMACFLSLAIISLLWYSSLHIITIIEVLKTSKSKMDVFLHLKATLKLFMYFFLASETVCIQEHISVTSPVGPLSSKVFFNIIAIIEVPNPKYQEVLVSYPLYQQHTIRCAALPPKDLSITDILSVSSPKLQTLLRPYQISKKATWKTSYSPL